MKSIAIMQPYFFPYIGYFQLIAAVDQFIVYDNIKYTKKGWINRNRILSNKKDTVISLPLKKDSDYLNICERKLSTDFNPEKFLNQIKYAYRRAPYFVETFTLIEEIIRYENKNLFSFLHHSIVKICEYIDIKTNIEISSHITIDHTLKNQDKVLALCDAVSASIYVNSIGGIKLYSKEIFRKKGVKLKFIQSKPFNYIQLNEAFIPFLSIIDVMMFNPNNIIREYLLLNYVLI